MLNRDDVQTHIVRMRDGVALATDVYLPDSVKRRIVRRAPVLFSRLPYGRREQVACLPAIAAEMTARGFAFVAQDVRGRYESGGTAAPFAVHELRDSYDTLDWIRAQPWASDGVVMVGDSYCGWLQWATMVSGHPSLRAIVPGMTSTGIGDTWMHDANSFCLWTMFEWAITAWSTRENRFVTIDWADRPLNDLVTSWLGGSTVASSFAEWTSNAPGSSYWRTNVFATVSPDRIQVPALHIGGWWDIFRRGQLSDWTAASRRRSNQYLVMSASDHHHVPLLADPWLGRHDDDDVELAGRYATTVAPFLEQVFGNGKARELPSVSFQVAHDGWHESPSWPPRGTGLTTLHLVDPNRATVDRHGGGLSRLRARESARLVWLHDPDNLVPAPESDPFALLVRAADQRVIEAREDVPTFSSVPLEEPLDLVGQSHVCLRGRAVKPGNQLIARLCDVFPDGRSFAITEGALTVASGAPDGVAALMLNPCAYRLQPGHSLRLEITASAFPRYLPGCTSDAWRDLGQSVEYELDIGGSSGSSLELSILQS